MERVTDLSQIQAADYTWRSKVGLDTETIDDIFPKFENEVRELTEVMSNGRDREDFVSELADISLMAIAMMSSLGIDASAAITSKIDRNFNKYRGEDIQTLQNDGMSHQQAMKAVKEKWDKTQDRNYVKGI